MELTSAKQGLPFNWNEKSIPYLGINLTASLSDFFSLNYPPTLKNISNLMKSWSHIPLSWFGRINAIKMTILSKMLYLFRVLPIPVPAYFLRILQNRILSYVWGSSKPRIQKYTLFLPKLKGGLACPNFAHYYKAAHLASITKYHANYEISLWVHIEAAECDPLLIYNLLWISQKDRKNLRNPITKHFLSLWDKTKIRNRLQSMHNPLLSFYKNPAFYPAWISPKSFREWVSLNFLTMHTFVNSSFFFPFPNLCESYGLPQSELFRYLQIKNFFTPYLNSDTLLNQLTSFETICKNDPHTRGIISLLYSQILEQPELRKPSYVQKWELDLERTLEIEDRKSFWSITKTISPNVMAVETNY